MSETAAKRTAKPTVGLMLSCGEPPTESRNYPKKLPYIRPKPGAKNQWAEYAEKFTNVYGKEPKSVDVIFVSDRLGDILDVRPILFAGSQLRAVGQENLAEREPDDFVNAIVAYDWKMTAFPKDSPEPREYVMKGRDDQLVRAGLKVYGTLRVAIPKVTGLMLIAEITTTSRRTIENWHANLSQALYLTNGVLVGVPHELRLRPAKTTYWDEKSKTRKSSEFFEWVIESSYDLDVLRQLAAERRRDLAAGVELPALPPVRHDDPERVEELELGERVERADEERRIRRAASELPTPGAGEPPAIREDATAGPDDSTLNRIAALEERLGVEAARLTLSGVFGLDDPRDLDVEDAAKYVGMLERAAEHLADDIVDGEAVEVVEEETVEPSPPPLGAEEAASAGDAADGGGAGNAATEEQPEDRTNAPEPPGDVPPSDPALELAGEVVVPGGRRKGKRIADLGPDDEEWVKWALANPEAFEGAPDNGMFVVALDFFVRSTNPTLYAKAKEPE